MLLDISYGSISAALVPHRLRSRVSCAFNVVNYGVRPIGAFAGGLALFALQFLGTYYMAIVVARAGAFYGTFAATNR